MSILTTLMGSTAGGGPVPTVINVKTVAITALDADYYNGAAGVGATLTANAAGAIGTLNGYAMQVGDAFLVSLQSDNTTNGIYVLSDGGSDTTPWIAIRSSAADKPSQLVDGLQVQILDGNNANELWVLTASVNTIGTDPILFVELGAYYAGTGLTLTNRTFSISNTGVSAGSYGSVTEVPVITVNAQGQLTSASTVSVSYAVNADALTGDTLASNVVNSSLESVGTLTSGSWQATTIGEDHGGTGKTTYTDGQILIGNSSGGLDAGDLQGTDNQITFTRTVGGIQAALPQNISATSSPHFADVHVDQNLYVTGSISCDGNIGAVQLNVDNVGTGEWKATEIGVAYGGTGLTTAPTAGQILMGGSSGDYVLTSTPVFGDITASNIEVKSDLTVGGSVGVNGALTAASADLGSVTSVGTISASEIKAVDTLTAVADSNFGGLAHFGSNVTVDGTLTIGGIDLVSPLDPSSGGTGIDNGSHTLTLTASTSISSAASTVLDDATVADMVNTLGGASSTGSGGLVRSNSPTLVTPNIGSATGSITGNAGTATALANGHTISITGDITYTSGSFDGSADVTGAGTLATVNSDVGTFGGPSKLASVTVNAKGLVTAASESDFSLDVTDITGLGSGVATFLAAPSSANLAAAVTDESGSGALVFGTSPTITTPTLSGLTTGAEMSMTSSAVVSSLSNVPYKFVYGGATANTGELPGLILSAPGASYGPVLMLQSTGSLSFGQKSARFIMNNDGTSNTDFEITTSWESGSVYQVTFTTGTNEFLRNRFGGSFTSSSPYTAIESNKIELYAVSGSQLYFSADTSTTSIYSRIGNMNLLANGINLKTVNGVTQYFQVTQTNIDYTGPIVNATWNGVIIGAPYGGTGINNGSNTLTLGAVTSITAAAATVLDDATVSDMVNTLGGASSTGSGGLVRATSPALVTPNIGSATGTSLTTTGTISTGGAIIASAGMSVGTNCTIGGTLGVTGHVTFEGVTATGATGTGDLVFSSAPSITSAALSGTSTTDTPSFGDDSTKIASTAYVMAAVNAAISQAATKVACQYATTAALPSVTYSNGSSGVGATLTATSNGALSIDGSSPTVGQRVLIKNQVSAAQNGIYLVTAAGDASNPFVLTRTTDFDTPSEAVTGAMIFIDAGVANISTRWQLITPAPITIGTTALNFNQIGGAGSTYNAGTGLTLSGSTFSITDTTVSAGSYGGSTAIPTFAVNAQGQLTAASTASVVAPAGTLSGTTLASNVVSSSLTSVGTLASGTWAATLISPIYGGTGINNGSNTLTLGAATTITSAAATVLDDTTVGEMVDTLGGAASTGTGGLVRANSPSFTTPNIGSATGSISGNAGTATALATGRTISISGDITYTSPSFDGTGNVTAAGTLATVNSNVGAFGSNTAAPAITVNAKGLVTAVTTNTITPALGSITGLGTNVATFLATPSSANLAAAITDETGSGSLVFSVSPALSGVPTAPTATTGDNTTQIATTAFVTAAVAAGGGSYTAGTGLTLSDNQFSITDTAVTAGSYGSASQVPVLTINAQGQITGATTATVTASADAGALTGTTLAANVVSSSLTSVGTLATGTWQASLIGATYGGTGVNNGTNTLTLGAATTITAAAATVLDDTTVAAMVNTLGGATSTGSGGLVRATSPTFVTPILGTPTSGTLTNCTGYAAANLTGSIGVANGGTGLTSAPGANQILVGNGSAYTLTATPQLNGLGVGVAPGSYSLRVQSNDPSFVAALERTGATSNAAFVAARLLATKTSTYANGFGPALVFSAQDTGAVIKDIAQLYAVMANAQQNTGNIVFAPYSNGTPQTALTVGYDRSLVIAGALTANSAKLNTTQYVYGASNSAWQVSNGSLPYLGAGDDLLIKYQAATTNNTAVGLQLTFNYIGTVYPGALLQTRNGNDANYRQNPEFVINQYLGTNPDTGSALNVWEDRIHIEYNRDINFSTTGSGTNEIQFTKGRNFLYQATTIQRQTLSGSYTNALYVGCGADTGLSGPDPIFTIASCNRSWATGTVNNHAQSEFLQPTYSSSGSTTFTSAATVSVANGPKTGVSTTINLSYGLIVGSTASTPCDKHTSLYVRQSTGASTNVCARFDGQVGINSDPVASSAFSITSTTLGFMPPRMSTTQRNAISSPGEGLMVYDNTLKRLCVRTNNAWEVYTSGVSGTATLVGGTVTVSTAKVTASSVIMLTTQTVGGTIGIQYISEITAGTSFTITSSSASDTSTVGWMIV